MHYRSILKALGVIILMLAAGLLIPTIYAFYLQDMKDVYAFGVTIGFSSVLGGICYLIPKSKDDISFRDGFVIVTFGWLGAAFFGSLPYLISGSATSFTDAFFESISGFTTTGASIFTDIEGLSNPILLWRSLTQWLGGMGIIVLSLAILPYLDLGGMSIFQAEVPGPTAEKLTPRIQDTAKILWTVYLFLTLFLFAFLWIAGMNFFDAINHAFTTMATGGFSTKNTSVAAFNSPAIEWIMIVFMFLGGVNFALHYQFYYSRFKVKKYWKDTEFLFYFLLIFISATSICFFLFFKTENFAWAKTIRDSTFMVTSIVTSTGFATADYELWGVFPQYILFYLMLIGGCAGSTSGGIKTIRIVLVVKYIYIELLKQIHPHLVRNVKIRDIPVDMGVMANLLGFIYIYMAVFLFSVLMVSIEMEDMVSAMGSVVACLSNIGPGFGSVGPTNNFAHLGIFTKWVLSLDMIMGRLELVTVLILFLPRTWRK